MNHIPSVIIDHCQRHQGCAGCSIKTECSRAIHSTRGFDDLMEKAVMAVQSAPRTAMTDRDFIASLGMTGLVGG
jgi:hypothetical protein